MGIPISSESMTSKEDLKHCKLKMKACLGDNKPCTFNRIDCFKKLDEFKQGN